MARMHRYTLLLLLQGLSLACARLQYNADEEFVAASPDEPKPWFASDATMFGHAIPISPVSILLCLVAVLRVAHSCCRNKHDVKTRKVLATYHNDIYAPREHALAFSPRQRGSKFKIWHVLSFVLYYIKAVGSYKVPHAKEETTRTTDDISEPATVSAIPKPQPHSNGDSKSNSRQQHHQGVLARVRSYLVQPFVSLNNIRIKIKNKVTKRLNPDATVADLGSTEKPFYDKQRGVWVFPGEDPETVAKPLAPPPIVPIAKPSITTAAATPPSDPFAAYMAPPKRSPAGLSRTTSHPGSASGSTLSTSGVKHPMSAGSVPPQHYAVFRPTPKTEGKKIASPKTMARTKKCLKPPKRAPPPPPPPR